MLILSSLHIKSEVGLLDHIVQCFFLIVLKLLASVIILEQNSGSVCFLLYFLDAFERNMCCGKFRRMMKNNNDGERRKENKEQV